MFLTVFQVFANDSYSQSTRLTLDVNNVSVENVLNAIEDQSEFYFLCNKKLVDIERKVSIQIENQNINDILVQVFDGTDVDYMIIDRQIVLSPGEYLTEAKSLLQPRTVSGTITDENGDPLPGLSVFIKGTTQGTVTNLEGEYTIQVEDESAVLVYSYIGYLTQEIEIGNQTTIDITMEPDIIGIEEVIAVGYGTQRRNDLTGSIISVNSEQLEPTLNTNLLKTLQGGVTGLRITQDNFEPGASQEIRIRGENSLSASNAPLIILDGIPYEGDMNDINPSDIESVSILKDASSAAIYGARSANGVILVNTKQGRKGRLMIDFNSSVGIASVANRSIHPLDGPGFVEFIQEHIRQETGVSGSDPLDWMFANEKAQYQAGTTTDWMDLVLRSAIQQDHVLSISGGTEQTSYYTSVGYLDQPGIVEKSGFDRITLRSNIRHSLSDWLSLGSNLQYSVSNHGEGGIVPSVSMAIIQSPYGKFRDDNGEYTHFPMYPEVYFSSPFADDNATADDQRKRALINLFAEIKPTFIPGLSYKINYGADFQNNKAGTYYPTNSLTGSQYGGRAIVSETDNFHWTFENILTYLNDFGDHHIGITGLYSREATNNEWTNVDANGFVNDDNLYHYMNSADTKDLSTTLDEFSLVSLMGRINYDFSKKYLLTVTARRDGYSGFGPDNKYAFFPSVALGWTISNESFAQNLPFDFLKLRISYGVNGNMAVSPYQTLDRYMAGNTIFGDNNAIINGLKISAVGNPELKWEGTATADVGVDFALLGNRLSGSLDYYQANSKDLLMTRQVPVMNGYTSIWYNIGKTENKGVELSLRGKIVQTSDFSWSANATFSLNRDKIVELRGEGEDDIANNWFIGEPLRVHYGYEWDGLWKAGDEAKFAAYAPNAELPLEKHLGKTRVKDTNGDGEISEEDRTVLGSQLPSWIGGLFNEVTYKNWSLTMFINTVQGIQRSNGWYHPQSFMVEKNMNIPDVEYWRGDRPSDEFISSARTYDPGMPSAGPALLKDASFVRIQNLTLAYELPQSVLETIKIRRLRVYVAANNLLTFTSWLGWDPEANRWGGFAGSIGQGVVPYPSPRIIKFGINLGL